MAKGQGKSSGQGTKLLYMRDYLYEQATPEHPKNAKDIQVFLEGHGIKASFKTIYNDIKVLKYEFNVPVEYNSSKWGYYITERKFSVKDLRMLVDCVQASPFITEREAQDITNKIKSMCDIYNRDSLNRSVYVKDRIHRVQDSVLKNVDIIHRALAVKRKISFKLYAYVGKRSHHKEQLVTTDIDRIIVSPKRLVWDNGYYYLETYNNGTDGGVRYQVELMDDIRILSQPIEANDNPSKESEENIQKMLDALLGKKSVITIRFRNEAAHDVLETLGYETITIPDDSHHFLVNLHDRIGFDFYMWLSGMGPYAKIISPPEAVDGYKQYLKDMQILYDEDIEPDKVCAEDDEFLEEFQRN